MLEDVEESRSFMKRMNRTGEITEITRHEILLPEVSFV